MMNIWAYEHICKKRGHNWAFKDCETMMLKVCLECGTEQYFFPEEVEENADVDDDNPEEE